MSAADVHTLGPSCAYYEEEPSQTVSQGSDPPKVKAQFFYISSLPIDDPLSPLPPIQSGKSAARQPPQPFSARDNAALEEAWEGFQNRKDSKDARSNTAATAVKNKFPFNQIKSPGDSGPSSPNLTPVGGRFGDRYEKKPGNFVLEEFYSRMKELPLEDEMRNPMTDTSPKRGPDTSQPPNESSVMLSQGSDKPLDAGELSSGDKELKARRKRQLSPFRSKEKDYRDTSPGSASVSTDAGSTRPKSQIGPKAGSDLTGRPFIRVPSSRARPLHTTDGTDDTDYRSDSEERSTVPQSRLRDALNPTDRSKKQVFVPVGVSRLHLVQIPDLLMKPIYWQAINDTSSVIRATWFFKDTMLPVPAETANRLEIGYEDMKPFSASYQDELDACVQNGSDAELKVVHKLWSDEKDSSRPSTAIDQKNVSKEMGVPDTSVTSAPEAHENAAADMRQKKSENTFETCSVIYVNSTDAQILKPNQLPSLSRSRRPLAPIRRGRQIGVAVVRGFDRKEWRKSHPNPKLDAKAAHAAVGAYISQSGDATTRDRRQSCAACEKEAPQVSDLVLVIHGIGQKLSERVDSFHFTHAINSLRREFNVELASEAVSGKLRGDAGIMVLPVNWRLTVSFDDDAKGTKTSAENSYHLSDITPNTLPNVRSLISDVMLDIPYYLSHHKQKMTSAVIKEANRVHRLWCRNNPGFQENGRVHLVAHSLGSAMALDILSQQPTFVPRRLDLNSQKVSDKMFEFNTTNLFNCGSPSGFFLLLNGAALVPRKGLHKTGMEGEDRLQGVAGDVGTYGCLAVHNNIYNIIHRNDPIAYQQNACVDRDYSASLVQATIPAATLGFFSRWSSALRLTSPSTAYGFTATPHRPPILSMPSTVEMDTHNFTREDVAEKRMYLLNDNGQIDFFLDSGGGPLEIQYLNMLSAHSSYWILQDFIRFLVVEVGRRPGRAETLPALRAQKKREYKKGSIA